MSYGPDNYQWIEAKPGDVLGWWTLERFLGTDRYGQRWLARCRCGRVLEHALTQLRYLVITKCEEPKCRSCSTRQRWAQGKLRGPRRRYYFLPASRAKSELEYEAWVANETDAVTELEAILRKQGHL